MHRIKTFVCFAGAVAMIAVLFVVAFVAPATVASAQQASAPVASAQQPPAAPGICPGQVLYGDDFKTLDSAWGQPDAGAYGPQTNSDAPGLRIAADAGKNNGRVNNVDLFRSVDICVSTTNANSPDPDDAAGLIFWAADPTDYYFLGISAGGQFAVLREANGQVSAVSPWSQTPALRTGANATNILQVNLVGTTATIVLNGYPIGAFVGTPAPNGGLVGLLAEATAKGATTWNFQHLIVTDPTRPATAAVASGAAAPAAPPQSNAPSAPQTKTAAAPPALWPIPPPVVAAPTAVAPPGEPLLTGQPVGPGGILYYAYRSQSIFGYETIHDPKGTPTAAATIGDPNATHAFGPLATDEKGNVFSTDGNTVVEYAAPNLSGSASNDINSMLSFTAASMDKPVALALDSHDAIYVVNAGSAGASILDFGAVAPSSAGAAPSADTRTPVATIAGDKTGLTNPVAIAFDGSDNIYVVNQTDQAANAQILEFAAGSAGNIAPIRIIAGDQTGLFTPTAIAVDEADTVYVTNAGDTDVTGKGTVPASITAYAVTSSGNAQPTRTIAGANTSLLLPSAIAVDGAGDLWVGTLSEARYPVSDLSNSLLAPLQNIPQQQVTNQGLVYSGLIVAFTPIASGNVAPVYLTVMMDQLSVSAGVRGPSGLALSPHNSLGPMDYIDPTPVMPAPPPAESVKPLTLGGGKPAIPLASGQPGVLLFSDAFKTFDAAWGAASDWAAVMDGSMVLKAASTEPQTWRLNDKQIYRNAEFHLKLAPAMAGSQSSGTFIFWATDFTSLTNCTCWKITIDPAGSADIEGVSGSASVYESGFIMNPAIKPGPDGWYDLDVALNGAVGTVAINGTQIAQFPAVPPDFGGLIGLAMQSPGAWAFTDLTAKALALPSSPDQAPVLGPPLYTVSFLPASNWLGYLKPDRGTVDIDATQSQQAAVSTYSASGIHNGDGAYEVTLQAIGGTDTANWGGLVFWGTGNSAQSYYCLTMTPGGAFAVRHMVSTAGPLSQQFADVIPSTPAAAIKTGFYQPNKLEVVLKGNAGTVYINDTKVGDFTGTPPANGGTIGLIAGAGASPASSWNVTDVEVHAVAQ